MPFPNLDKFGPSPEVPELSQFFKKQKPQMPFPRLDKLDPSPKKEYQNRYQKRKEEHIFKRKWTKPL